MIKLQRIISYSRKACCKLSMIIWWDLIGIKSVGLDYILERTFRAQWTPYPSRGETTPKKVRFASPQGALVYSKGSRGQKGGNTDRSGIFFISRGTRTLFARSINPSSSFFPRCCYTLSCIFNKKTCHSGRKLCSSLERGQIVGLKETEIERRIGRNSVGEKPTEKGEEGKERSYGREF